MDRHFYFCIQQKSLPFRPPTKICKQIVIEGCEIGRMCRVPEHIPAKITEKKRDLLSLVRSGIVMQQDHQGD